MHAIAPFRLDLTVWVLRRRQANRIDSWNGQTYRRAMILGSQNVVVSVEQNGSADQAELDVTLACEKPSPLTKQAAEPALVRLLGLHIDMSGFYAMAQADAHLRPLVERFTGMKPPLYPTLFESIANAIIFQQISLDAGISILNRLAAAFGTPFDCGKERFFLFPEASFIAGLSPEEIKRVGMSANKARALVEGAQRITKLTLSLEGLEKMDNESAFAELVKFRGIGRWSADYVLLRGLGRVDVFPRGDIGARAGLNRWLKADGRLSDTEIEDIMSKWHGYGGLVYFHLLLNGLAEKGFIM